MNSTLRNIELQDLDPKKEDEFDELVRRMKVQLVGLGAKVGVWHTVEASAILDIMARKTKQ